MAISGLRMVQFSREFRVHAPPRKILRLKFSEMQSSAFWTLEFRKMPGIHIEHVMLKYLIKPQKRDRDHLGPPLNPPMLSKTSKKLLQAPKM